MFINYYNVYVTLLITKSFFFGGIYIYLFSTFLLESKDKYAAFSFHFRKDEIFVEFYCVWSSKAV